MQGFIATLYQFEREEVRLVVIKGECLIDVISVVVELGYGHLVKQIQEISPFDIEYALSFTKFILLYPPVFQPITFLGTYVLPEGILVIVGKFRKINFTVIA